MAWLRTAPDDGKGKAKRRAPIEEFAEKGVEPDMPPCDALYLTEYLLEVGPVMSGAMGPIVVTQQEIAKYQSNMGIELLPWEVRAIRRASGAYLDQMMACREGHQAMPWRDHMGEEQRSNVGNALKSALAGLRVRPKPGRKR